MRGLKVSLVGILLLALSACSLLGVAKPESFDQRLTYTYSTQTAAAEQVADKTRAGLINNAENERLVEIIQNSKEIADSARAVFVEGKPESAEAKLLLAKNILLEVEDYVRRLR